MRRSSEVSRALAGARREARLTLTDLGRALGVHPRTVRRWELGESKPRERQWTRVLAFYAERAPSLAQTLAASVGRALPAHGPAPIVDPYIASRVVAMAADAIDVAPKRVREVLRAAVHAAAAAGLSFEMFARVVVEEVEAARDSY